MKAERSSQMKTDLPITRPHKSGTMTYRCRRCGETFTNGTYVTDARQAILDVTEKGTTIWLGAILYDKWYHQCDDNLGIGVADFIGIEFKEKP